MKKLNKNNLLKYRKQNSNKSLLKSLTERFSDFNLTVLDDDDEDSVLIKSNKSTVQKAAAQSYKEGLSYLMSPLFKGKLTDDDIKEINIIENDNKKLYIFNDQQNQYFAYCDWSTYDIVIGNVSSYPTSRWITITKPLIDIVSNYSFGGHVYIASLYNKRIKKTIKHKNTYFYLTDFSELNEEDIQYTQITENVSFFHCYYNNEAYYLPNIKNGDTTILDDKFKIDDNFVNNFGGILPASSVTQAGQLYIAEFSSNNAYLYTVKQIVKNGFKIKDEYNIEYTEDNIDSFIKNSEIDINTRKKEVNDKNAIFEKFLIKHLGQEGLDNIMQLIKSMQTIKPYKLFIGDFSRPRISKKNIYAKLNTDVTNKFLEDNDINFDKIINKQKELLNYYIDKEINSFIKNNNITDEIINEIINSTNSNSNDSYNILKKIRNFCEEVTNNFSDNLFAVDTYKYDIDDTSAESYIKQRLISLMERYSDEQSGAYNNFHASQLYLALFEYYLNVDNPNESHNAIDYNINNIINRKIIKNPMYVYSEFGNHPFDFKSLKFSIKDYEELYYFYYVSAKILETIKNMCNTNDIITLNEKYIKSNLVNEPTIKNINFSALDECLKTTTIKLLEANKGK